MSGCIKNEFIKLRNKSAVLLILTLVLIGGLIVHLVFDVVPYCETVLEWYENGRKLGRSVSNELEFHETEVENLRTEAAKAAAKGQTEKAEAMLKMADDVEQVDIPRLENLLELGVTGTASWKYQSSFYAGVMYYRGNKEMMDLFDKAVSEDDHKLFLRTVCRYLEESDDPLELLDYYCYSFLLETDSVPDKNTDNWSRASRYADNVYAISISDSEEETNRLTLENEYLYKAAALHAGEAGENPSIIYIKESVTIDVLIVSASLLGVASAGAVFGVDRKRKKIPAVYLLPVSRTRTNLSKMICAAAAGYACVVLFFAAFFISAVIFGGGSLFETVYMIFMGRPVFCTPFGIMGMLLVAMLPVVVLAVLFVFFFVALTKKAPLAVVMGVILSVLYFVYRVRVFNKAGEVYWLKYSIVSVSDWTPFILETERAPEQSFLWTVVAFALHAIIFTVLGLFIENHSED